MSEQANVPPAVAAARDYLQGRMTYEQMRAVEEAADPLDGVRWLTERQTTLAIERDAAIRERDELRAILAPGLKHPLTTLVTGPGSATAQVCFFCENYVTDGLGHAARCPTRRRAALLGEEE